MRDQYSILALCAELDVSPSGYYDWRQRLTSPGPRALENQLLATRITELHEQSRETYGSPRIVMELRKSGVRHGRNRIARLMKQEGLCGRQKARYRVQTTDSNHDEPIAPNRLAEAPKASAPNQIWVADITYIETGENWLFVAAIMDLYSRKIVGWAMGEHIDTALILKALFMALLHQQPPVGLLFHSDRGVQYASADYRSALTRAGLVASMSTLKLELVYRRDFQTLAHARSEIFDYIEAFYNRQRSHSALNYLSPVDFELQNN
jgi:transposase InsO family protein